MSLDSGSAAAYEYDGLHRRTTRTEAGVAKHFYYNERWQVLTETDASGTAQAIYSYFPHYVDAVAVRMTPASDHFYLCDALASVTAIVDNETNAVVERYAYSPYGRITVLDANYAVDEDNTSDIGNELLYTGRRTDPGAGLQLNRYRYYHSGLGRWLNRDPIEYWAGDMNLYGYVGGMPTYWIDPLGLQQFMIPSPVPIPVFFPPGTGPEATSTPVVKCAAATVIGAGIGSIAGPEGTVVGGATAGCTCIVDEMFFPPPPGPPGPTPAPPAGGPPAGGPPAGGPPAGGPPTGGPPTGGPPTGGPPTPLPPLLGSGLEGKKRDILLFDAGDSAQ